MPRHDSYQKGKWLACCDICGLTFYNDQLAQDWDGSWRCLGAAGKRCYEGRQPQDFVRGVTDDQSTPWSRPWVPLFVDTVTGSGLGEIMLGDDPVLGGP